MKKYLTLTLATIVAASTSASMLIADGHDKAQKSAVKARQAQMTLYSHNLGILGAMAKGSQDYDSAAAQAAADNLAALATMSQAGFWLPSTDSDSIEGTRALPAIWQEGSKAGEIGKQLADAAIAMKAAAGTDLASLQAAMGGVGAACKACHEGYRKPR